MHVAACQWFPLFKMWREVIPRARRSSTFYILEKFGLKSEVPVKEHGGKQWEKAPDISFGLSMHACLQLGVHT